MKTNSFSTLHSCCSLKFFSTQRKMLKKFVKMLQWIKKSAYVIYECPPKARMDSLQESEETMAELKNVYEREKLMLMEENKKLQFEYERTVEINNRLQLERRQFEEDYHDLRNKKEAVAQWEAQISEIINWYVFLSAMSLQSHF